MVKEIKDFSFIYLVQIGFSVFLGIVFRVYLLNPYYLLSVLFISLILAAILISFRFINLPSYRLEKYVKKWYVIFLFISIVPTLSNLYIHYRIYNIETVEDFLKINWSPYSKYTIGNDLDFQSFSNEEHQYIIENFHGKLDGKEHTISNLKIPLFMNIDNEILNATNIKKAEIKNLNLTNVRINSENVTSPVGALAYYNYGNIRNVHVYGEIKGTKFVGGIIGINHSLIELSSFNGRVQGISYVGGISGANSSSIKATYAKGEVTGQTYIGGLVGVLKSTYYIEDCYTDVEIIGKSNVGGIGGGSLNNSGKIKGSIVLGSITGSSTTSVLAPFLKQDYKGLMLGEINNNNYQYEENIYYNNLSFVDAPIERTVDWDLMTMSWFVNELKLTRYLWDFAPILEEKPPILR